MTIAVAAYAVPARPGLIEKRLPDGSVLRLRLTGDEFFNCLVTEDGCPVVRAEDGYYCYARFAGRVPVSTGVRAVSAEHRTAETRALADRLRAESKAMTPAAASGSQLHGFGPDGRPRNAGSAPRSGVTHSRGLVILVNFADRAFVHTRAEFDSLLNRRGYTAGGATGSAVDYFADNSSGQFVPQFDVFGPYTLDHDMAYYGARTSSGESDVRPAQMVLDAVRKLAADSVSGVDFSLYDGNYDRDIDNVFVYYAGYGENQGAGDDCIWPHRWAVGYWNTDAATPADLTFNGYSLYDYACACELTGSSGNTICGIGAFCHEFSHVLGLKDLYINGGSSNHKTMGYWDLMDIGCYNNNERTPAGYSAFERFYAGWLTPERINAPGRYTLPADGQAHLLTATGAFNGNARNPQPLKYCIVENRQLSGWDAYLPGHGMLVELINWNSSKWLADKPNNDPHAQVVDLIEAAYCYHNLGCDSDPFPGTARVDSLGLFPGVSLVDITETDGQITFRLEGDSVGVAVDNAEMCQGPVLMRADRPTGTARVMNIAAGAQITLLDATGRALMEAVAESDEFVFTEPRTFYFVVVEKAGERLTLK